MKKNLYDLMEKTDAPMLGDVTDGIRPEKMPRDMQKRIEKKISKGSAAAPLRRVLIPALAAALCLAVLFGVLAATGAFKRGDPDETAENTSGDTQYAGPGTEQGGVVLLTSPVFSSDRSAAPLSEEFRRAYCSFSVELLKRAGGSGSALVSPLSVYIAMLTVTNGAKGETREELRRTLGGELTVEHLNGNLFSFFESLSNGADARLESANSVWLTDRTDFHVNGEFIKLVENTFRADIYTAPFSEKSTVDAINRWCSYRTNEMIKEILDYEDVSFRTVSVLVNALSFDALWAEQYEKKDTGSAVFHGESGNREVLMMYSNESRYLSGEKEKGFLKNYAGGGYAFMALLPEKGTSVDDYLSGLTGDRFIELCASEDIPVRCGLPAFSLDWSGSLAEVFQSMGVGLAFDTARSDLSGLGYVDSGDPLYIEKIIHKAHIDVDESGTRAAAATAVVVDDEVASPDPVGRAVILDRPFVYAIVDTSSMLPVFIGTVRDVK